MTNGWSVSGHHYTPQDQRLWSIVLAGGEGIRTREFIKHHLGVTKPKQYCSFVGTRSLLQHTVDRADALSPPKNRVVVVAREHRAEAVTQMERRAQGTLLSQPRNCGTAPGLFLALTQVVARDPDATVMVLPSDHYVYPESAFIEALAQAAALADELRDRVVLLGVSPSSPETDYGWIQPGEAPLSSRVPGARDVAYFIEKPEARVAEAALRGGALWNTSIVAAKVRTLWELGWRYAPEMMAPFMELWDSFARGGESLVLERIYREMPTLDLSRHVLQRASKHLAVMELDGIFWSDWGSPPRILETLERLGVPAACATARVPHPARARQLDEPEMIHARG
ncbi:MAG: sugar phosphate nucleotidyltransferase [Vicinamibacteria bacterium]